MVRFPVNLDKLVNAMAYICQKCSGVSKMQMCKILYFADKEHLLQYGRPITGDVYARLEHGPVPSLGLNMMRGKTSARSRASYGTVLRTEKNHEIRLVSEPDLEQFSRSDIAELDAAIQKYGRMSAAQLRDLSHDEATWIKTPANALIAFELMFEGRDEAAPILEMLEQECLEDQMAAAIPA